MKRFISCIAPALLGAIMAVPASAYTLQGRVLDQDTMAPIPNAGICVRVLDPDSLKFGGASDDAGNYVIADMPPGNSVYAVSCSSPGYQYFYGYVDALADGDVTFDILLGAPDPPPPPGEPPPDSGSVSGQVLARDGMGALHPVAGATVTLESPGGTTVAVTDAAGAYETWVGFGTYAIAVAAQGFDPLAEPEFPVGEGGARFDAVLNPASTTGVPDAGPARARLGPVAPHPVRAASTLTYSLAAEGPVELSLFDAAGRHRRTLVSAWESAGPHAVAVDARGLPSGAYFCRLRFGGAVVSKMLMIVR